MACSEGIHGSGNRIKKKLTMVSNQKTYLAKEEKPPEAPTNGGLSTKKIFIKYWDEYLKYASRVNQKEDGGKPKTLLEAVGKSAEILVLLRTIKGNVAEWEETWFTETLSSAYALQKAREFGRANKALTAKRKDLKWSKDEEAIAAQAAAATEGHQGPQRPPYTAKEGNVTAIVAYVEALRATMRQENGVAASDNRHAAFTKAVQKVLTVLRVKAKGTKSDFLAAANTTYLALQDEYEILTTEPNLDNYSEAIENTDEIRKEASKALALGVERAWPSGAGRNRLAEMMNHLIESYNDKYVGSETLSESGDPLMTLKDPSAPNPVKLFHFLEMGYGEQCWFSFAPKMNMRYFSESSGAGDKGEKRVNNARRVGDEGHGSQKSDKSQRKDSGDNEPVNGLLENTAKWRCTACSRNGHRPWVAKDGKLKQNCPKPLNNNRLLAAKEQAAKRCATLLETQKKEGKQTAGAAQVKAASVHVDKAKKDKKRKREKPEAEETLFDSDSPDDSDGTPSSDNESEMEEQPPSKRKRRRRKPPSAAKVTHIEVRRLVRNQIQVTCSHHGESAGEKAEFLFKNALGDTGCDLSIMGLSPSKLQERLPEAKIEKLAQPEYFSYGADYYRVEHIASIDLQIRTRGDPLPAIVKGVRFYLPQNWPKKELLLGIEVLKQLGIGDPLLQIANKFRGQTITLTYEGAIPRVIHGARRVRRVKRALVRTVIWDHILDSVGFLADSEK